MECVYFISGFVLGSVIVLTLFKLIRKDENDIEVVLNRVLENYNKHFLFQTINELERLANMFWKMFLKQ
ncbi:MAG: hypothetical protein L6V95_14010 [Candidatus Melainabacteria bacterium]|nr:MAG: hypothetical protein L6V95_14010 [Candidatus Melainabacteria bacterium]